jgi:hypothetical protein
VGLIVIVGLTAWISLAWERHQVNDLSAKATDLKVQIVQERASLAELNKRDGRVHWSTCGGRLCFEASSRNAYWNGDNGKKQYVVPMGY